jgi:pimeloyl-ACP methyl ester carboxylesterase
MTAVTLWRSILGSEFALALLMALAITSAGPPLWSSVPIALGIAVLFQYLLVGAATLTSQVLSARAEGPSISSSRWLAALTEPICFAMAQMAMSAPRSPPPCTAGRFAAGDAARPLLLVHGLICNSGIWRWLLKRLTAEGFADVHVIDLFPLDAGLEQQTELLEREVLRIRSLHSGSAVTIVAHSMGGVLARALLRSLGPETIRHVITIATPHRGAATARLLAWPAAKDLCVASSWLTALNAPGEHRAAVPLTSIYSRDDHLVRPADSANIPGAKSLELRGIGHFGLLIRRRALDVVMTALEEHS